MNHDNFVVSAFPSLDIISLTETLTSKRMTIVNKRTLFVIDEEFNEPILHCAFIFGILSKDKLQDLMMISHVFLILSEKAKQSVPAN